jgi:hypothetical protein
MAKCVDAIIRFNQKYVVDEETGCWQWIGPITEDGYGQFSIQYKSIRAHRFSYKYYVGPLEDGLVIAHICNNRKCVNYNHLRQDTHKSNSIDMVISNNQWKQKLSVEEVIQIKKELKCYYRGQYKNLSDIYGVDPTTISQIKRGLTWSHVEVD